MSSINWFCFVTPAYKAMAESNPDENWEKFLGQKVSIIPYDDQGSWESNCLYRPQLLFKQATFSSATGLIDADVIFRKIPGEILSPRQGCDVSMVRTGDPVLSRYYSAGLLLVSPSERGQKFLREWAENCKRNDFNPEIGLREQYALYYTVEHVKPNVNCLPKTYCYVPPKGKIENEPKDTVVYHLPASREIKKLEQAAQSAQFAQSQSGNDPLSLAKFKEVISIQEAVEKSVPTLVPDGVGGMIEQKPFDPLSPKPVSKFASKKAKAKAQEKTQEVSQEVK